MFGTLAAPLISCTTGSERSEKDTEEAQGSTTEFTLPDLPYDYNALAPHIDARTMEIHHSRHHAGYVSKLNAALQDSGLAGLSLEDMLSRVTEKDPGVRNNGGGHFNHSLFWTVMSPEGGGNPVGELSKAIDDAFDSFEAFKDKFAETAGSVFGSGWAWLCKDENQNLFITSTPNQDNPLMLNLADNSGTPILGIDVWEHAYYLKYQNKRGEYISNFFNIINWEEVNRRYEESV